MLDFFGSQLWTNLLCVFVLAAIVHVAWRKNRREYDKANETGSRVAERQQDPLLKLDRMIALLEEISSKLEPR